MATKNWGCWSMSVCFGFAFSFAVMHLVFVSSTIIHLNLNSVPFNFINSVGLTKYLLFPVIFYRMY